MKEDENWLIGFVGEGMFSWRTNRGSGRRTYPYFTVTDTDKSAIEKAKDAR